MRILSRAVAAGDVYRVMIPEADGAAGGEGHAGIGQQACSRALAVGGDVGRVARLIAAPDLHAGMGRGADVAARHQVRVGQGLYRSLALGRGHAALVSRVVATGDLDLIAGLEADVAGRGHVHTGVGQDAADALAEGGDVRALGRVVSRTDDQVVVAEHTGLEVAAGLDGDRA